MDEGEASKSVAAEEMISGKESFASERSSIKQLSLNGGTKSVVSSKSYMNANLDTGISSSLY